MPTHSWKDGSAFSTPLKCELMPNVAERVPHPEAPGSQAFSCSLLCEADADGIFFGGGGALCDSTVPLHVHPLALCTRGCRTKFNLIISPPRLPTTLCYVRAGRVQKLTRCAFAFEENPKLIREPNTGRAGEKGWVGKIRQQETEWVAFELHPGCRLHHSLILIDAKAGSDARVS